MTFEDYVAKLGLELSAVKLCILKRLCEEGSGFPKGWVSSKELLDLTRQKYFDRRIRELRDEYGCDIETGSVNGQSAYRIRSSDLNRPNPRSYLSAHDKRRLFLDADYECATCGRKFPRRNKMGLQADHKVPLSRMGPDDYSNWQPLCTECNVAKRRACQGCSLDCQVCVWAFPEQFRGRVVVNFSHDELQLLRIEADRARTSVPEFVRMIAMKSLKR